MCLAAASEVQSLLAENLELIAEVNRWREQFSNMSPCRPKPLGDGVAALLKVDQEVFGTFPGGFGDNSNGDGGDDDHRVGNHERHQTEDGRQQIPPLLPVSETPKVINVPPDTSPQNDQTENSPPVMGARPSTLTNVPANGAMPGSEQQIDLLDPSGVDFYTALGNAYGNNLDANFGMASAAHNFDDLNMDQNLFLDIPLPIPDLNYTLTNVPANGAMPGSEQQIDLLDPSGVDFYTALGNAYGNNLDANFGMASAAHNFDDLNMDQNLFLDIPLPIPDLNYNPHENFHFGY